MSTRAPTLSLALPGGMGAPNRQNRETLTSRDAVYLGWGLKEARGAGSTIDQDPRRRECPAKDSCILHSPLNDQMPSLSSSAPRPPEPPLQLCWPLSHRHPQGYPLLPHIPHARALPFPESERRKSWPSLPGRFSERTLLPIWIPITNSRGLPKGLPLCSPAAALLV